ncbi:hypothetical protein HWV01_16365 [Moritella sp. 5]|uniref:hypothetical protein n=1 Tax=Moritella sp. 5 TaxID=2746231 RepID=UPI001BA491B6|nr:hypothetical protein [Moritella sp. 5]QUM81747.1 hypothetical protein HWV01_16365 [Moritella sp. 5]
MSYFDDADKRRTKELQKSIKQTIALLGWSLKDFVGKYMIETHDYVGEEDINQFYETVRKQMERDSTSKQLLVKYHSFLFSTDEYKKLRTISDNSSTPHSYPLMNISETPYESPSNNPKEEERDVLSMAISYAEMMGICWDFTLIKNDLVTYDSILEFDGPFYLVVYQCDFGFNGGNGCRGVGIIEIQEKRRLFGGFFITDKKCELDFGGARFSHVVGMKEGELIIMVKDFDSLDLQVGQTLFAKVILSKNIDNSNEWKVKSKEYIHKDLATDLYKLESGYT